MPFKNKEYAKQYFTNYNHKRAVLVKEAMQALKEKQERENEVKTMA
jgi:hypothetical protein